MTLKIIRAFSSENQSRGRGRLISNRGGKRHGRDRERARTDGSGRGAGRRDGGGGGGGRGRRLVLASIGPARGTGERKRAYGMGAVKKRQGGTEGGVPRGPLGQGSRRKGTEERAWLESDTRETHTGEAPGSLCVGRP